MYTIHINGTRSTEWSKSREETMEKFQSLLVTFKKRDYKVMESSRNFSFAAAKGEDVVLVEFVEEF